MSVDRWLIGKIGENTGGTKVLYTNKSGLSTKGTYTLEDNIMNYKYISIYSGWISNNANSIHIYDKNVSVIHIPVPEDLTQKQLIVMPRYENSSNKSHMYLNFSEDGTSFTITTVSGLKIYDIVGRN